MSRDKNRLGYTRENKINAHAIKNKREKEDEQLDTFNTSQQQSHRDTLSWVERVKQSKPIPITRVYRDPRHMSASGNSIECDDNNTNDEDNKKNEKEEEDGVGGKYALGTSPLHYLSPSFTLPFIESEGGGEEKKVIRRFTYLCIVDYSDTFRHYLYHTIPSHSYRHKYNHSYCPFVGSLSSKQHTPSPPSATTTVSNILRYGDRNNDAMSREHKFLLDKRWSTVKELIGSSALYIILNSPQWVERLKPPSNVKFEGSCFHCGSPNHSQNYCPIRKCNVCQYYGHWGKVCKSPSYHQNRYRPWKLQVSQIQNKHQETKSSPYHSSSHSLSRRAMKSNHYRENDENLDDMGRRSEMIHDYYNEDDDDDEVMDEEDDPFIWIYSDSEHDIYSMDDSSDLEEDNDPVDISTLSLQSESEYEIFKDMMSMTQHKPF